MYVSGVRIGDAAARSGLTPRMLRYREHLGLLPRPGRTRTSGRHRRYGERDLVAVRAGLELEHRYGASPAELAFALRTLADPTVAAAVRGLGVQLGRIPAVADAELRAELRAEIDRERALRWLGRSGMLPEPPR